MRILVIGSGGREHAIGKALVTDPSVELFSAPGNPGLAELGRTLAVDPNDHGAVVAACREAGVELVVVGPEAPLVGGLGDAVRAAGILCCGPSAGAARLEASKTFTRELGKRARLPAPRYQIVTTEEQLRRSLDSWRGAPPVVKADGLAGGKGVYLPEDHGGCLQVGRELLQGSLGAAGKTLVLEERLQGDEASLFYACHNLDYVALPHAQDHKRLLDGDMGPNTGGMGAVSPNPRITEGFLNEVGERFVRPTLQALLDEGTPYSGFLFVGLMLTLEGPKLLEYNVRLGDPETQAILPRLADGEMRRLCEATARGQMRDLSLSVLPDATCAVVLAAEGYPESPRKGHPITVDSSLHTPQRWLIQAGTQRAQDGLTTAGGRVAAVVARGPDLRQAIASAYEGVKAVRFPGMQFRRDIGKSALE